MKLRVTPLSGLYSRIFIGFVGILETTFSGTDLQVSLEALAGCGRVDKIEQTIPAPHTEKDFPSATNSLPETTRPAKRGQVVSGFLQYKNICEQNKVH